MSDNLERGARVIPRRASAGQTADEADKADWPRWQPEWDTESPSGDEEPAFKPLTHDEAQALLAQHPPLSPWRIVMVQAVAGLVVAALWAALRGEAAGWSALYGAAAVVLPQAMLARVMSRLPTGNVRAMALRFMVWEMVKIALAVSMLAAAQFVVPELSWPALLVALVVCLKASWLALLMKRRRPG